MGDRVLTRRELNRALLARQLLLERRVATVPRAVEQLAGLQAQYTPSPYLSLHARLDGFARDDLTRALERRKVVKALLMRGTLHIVTPRDFWAFATARAAMGTAYWPPAYEKLFPRRKIAQVAKATIAELDEPKTFAEIAALLKPHASGPVTPTFLWRRVQGQGHVVHVPPSGTWGYHKDGVYQAADATIAGEPPDPDAARAHLVRRYLAAFGPATKHDIGQWAGVPRVGPIAETLERMKLRTFADEQGRTLYDVPRAPLPDADTPAPVRLVPRYDNLVLAHADRKRILGDVPVTRIVTKNALVHASILVDGFVAGTWSLEKGRVELHPFGRLPREAKAALKEEVERVETFAA